MSTVSLWLAVVGSGAITFALRLSFIALLGRIEIPVSLSRALRFVPAAVCARCGVHGRRRSAALLRERQRGGLVGQPAVARRTGCCPDRVANEKRAADPRRGHGGALDAPNTRTQPVMDKRGYRPHPRLHLRGHHVGATDSGGKEYSSSGTRTLRASSPIQNTKEYTS
jgi:hypothetical protein